MTTESRYLVVRKQYGKLDNYIQLFREDDFQKFLSTKFDRKDDVIAIKKVDIEDGEGLNMLINNGSESVMNYKDHLHMVPEHMHDGIILYMDHGIEPGSFLRKIICNEDIVSVLESADSINQMAVVSYIKLFYNYFPQEAWKSVENYNNWIKKGGLKGRG